MLRGLVSTDYGKRTVVAGSLPPVAHPFFGDHVDQPPFLIEADDEHATISTRELPTLLIDLDALVLWHRTINAPDPLIREFLVTAAAIVETTRETIDGLDEGARYWTTLGAMSDVLLVKATLYNLDGLDDSEDA